MVAATDSGLNVEKPLTEVERVVDTFVAPSKTFTDIKHNASWWVPFLVIAAFWCGLAFVADAKIGLDTEVNNELQLTPKQADRLEKLSPEDRSAQLNARVKGTRVFWRYLAPIFALVMAAVTAGLMLGTFNFGFGARLRFNQCMANYMYSSLPLIIKVSIAILVFFLGAGEGFTFGNPVASNLGALVPIDLHFVHFLASAVDVFTIWSLILAGIGYSCLTGIKRSTCLTVIFVWWAVITVAISGVTALFA